MIGIYLAVNPDNVAVRSTGSCPVDSLFSSHFFSPCVAKILYSLYRLVKAYFLRFSKNFFTASSFFLASKLTIGIAYAFAILSFCLILLTAFAIVLLIFFLSFFLLLLISTLYQEIFKSQYCTNVFFEIFLDFA